MLQMLMFDAKGQPTELAMRYVVPRYYKICSAGGFSIAKRPQTAIRMWLMHPDTKIEVVW